MPNSNEPLASELIQALNLLADTFRAHKVQYSLIGGLAVFLRGRPRYTRDIDILLDVPQIKLPNLVEDLQQRGFDLNPTIVIQEFIRHRITSFRFGGVRVDWIGTVLPLYARALNDATALDWPQHGTINVATAEGLTLTKLVAFRPRDREDIETLLMANRTTFDQEIVRSEWAPLAKVEPQKTAWIEDAFARILPPAEGK